MRELRGVLAASEAELEAGGEVAIASRVIEARFGRVSSACWSFRSAGSRISLCSMESCLIEDTFGRAGATEATISEMFINEHERLKLVSLECTSSA